MANDFSLFPPTFSEKTSWQYYPNFFHQNQQAWWRNGSASDSSSEGCVFKSRPGHNVFFHTMFFFQKFAKRSNGNKWVDSCFSTFRCRLSVCPFSSLAKNHTVTRTWFEHATFWTGVRRATIAPPGLKKFRESLRLDLVSVWTFRNLCLLCHSLLVFAFLNLSGLLAAVKVL